MASSKVLPVFLCFSIFLGSISAASFSSSSESCEDDHHHGGGNGNGNGGGNGNGNNGGGNNNGGGGGANRGCPSGWQRFNRPSGGWCIRVFPGMDGQADAETKCSAQGGVVSGIQNQAEAIAIGRMALSIMSQSSGSIRIGLRRRQACSTSPISSTCNSMNSFWWSDRVTTGTDGLLWNRNQPDNAHSASQQCVVLLASRTPTVTDSWVWQANRLDDVGCVMVPGESARQVRGFACGKKANN